MSNQLHDWASNRPEFSNEENIEWGVLFARDGKPYLVRWDPGFQNGYLPYTEAEARADAALPENGYTKSVVWRKRTIVEHVDEWRLE